MTIDVDIKEIKELVETLNKKIDLLIEDRENLAPMMLAQKPLNKFLDEEPDLYSIDDIKVRYR